MNEKQRWLLRDLEAWETKAKKGIGYWSSYDAQRPASIRAKRQQIKRLEKEIKDWETAQAAPFEKARQRVADKVRAVKHVILFESTENALRAVRALDKPRVATR